MANDDGVTRREFVSTATGAALGALVASETVGSAAQAKRRYAIVGTGVRGIGMWGRPLLQRYADNVEFVGLCDINPKRAELAKAARRVVPDLRQLRQDVRRGEAGAAHRDDRRSLPRRVHRQGARSRHRRDHREADGDRRGAVPAGARRRGPQQAQDRRRLQLPLRAEAREDQGDLQSGEIGTVTGVDFHWYLDTSHGADYFRRWHRLRQNGSLWMHKATTTST